MSLEGALVGGGVGTLILTTGLRAAAEAGLTRIDLPFLLGTAFTENRPRARAVGYALHLAMGLVFALMYHAAFRAVGAGLVVGTLLGLVHGLFAATTLVNVLLPLVHPRMGSSMTAADGTPRIEPPGFLMLNYGVATPIATVLAHLAYGACVGGLATH
mgnify:CR=1 FL=1